MAIEIERKYLLANEGWRDEVHASTRISQGYLGGTRASVRVRVTGDQANLNIKARQKGVQRLEYEYPIPLSEARELLEQLTEPGTIDKTRHLVRAGALTWEIDEFHGANEGLIVAEIELPSIDHPVPAPPWRGTEVTDDERYYNVYLAQNPYSQWPVEARR